MGIKPLFKPADIRKELDKALTRIEAAIVLNLQYLGEECVNDARSNRGYRDQTGNLVNSTGYIIARDGVILKRNFKRSASVKGTSKSGKETVTKGSKDGVKVGETLAIDLLSSHTKGFVLIVVAGMNYAAKVEAKNKNVLSSAEQYAKKELPGLMAKLKLQIERMK